MFQKYRVFWRARLNEYDIYTEGHLRWIVQYQFLCIMTITCYKIQALAQHNRTLQLLDRGHMFVLHIVYNHDEAESRMKVQY